MARSPEEEKRYLERKRKMEESDRRSQEIVYPVVRQTVGDYDDRRTYPWIALKPMTRQQYQWRLQDSRDPDYYDPEYSEILKVFDSELERDNFLNNDRRISYRNNPVSTNALIAFGIGYFLGKK